MKKTILLLSVFCLLFTNFLFCASKKQLNEFYADYNKNRPELDYMAYAIEKDYDDVAIHLINQGENLKQYHFRYDMGNGREHIHSKHPFLTAISKGKIDVVKAILIKYPLYNEGGHCDSWSKYFGSRRFDHIEQKRALHVAIVDSVESYEMVKLIALLSDINQKDRYHKNPYDPYFSMTPLEHAIDVKKIDVAEFLIILSKTEVLQPALWHAVKKNYYEGVVLLISYGAKVDFEMVDFASKKSYIEIANLLMDAYSS